MMHNEPNSPQRQKVAQLQLRSDQKKQVIRLVNPRNEWVSFQFDEIPGITIDPSVGSLKPRDFVQVELAHDFIPRSSSILNLTYWHDKKSRGPKANRQIQWLNTIPIYVMTQDPVNSINNSKVTYWRIMRSIVLICLIVYNLCLIYRVNSIWTYN